MSPAAMGNGRCVEVSSARIDLRYPQYLGFPGKLDSEIHKSMSVLASGRMVTLIHD